MPTTTTTTTTTTTSTTISTTTSTSTTPSPEQTRRPRILGPFWVPGYQVTLKFSVHRQAILAQSTEFLSLLRLLLLVLLQEPLLVRPIMIDSLPDCVDHA